MISPIRDLDPPCGDIVHTEAMLGQPPPDVVYETYAEALRRGSLIENGNREALRRAWKTGRDRWRETWTTLLAKGVNLLRRWQVLFWEPFRLFSVRAGEYDLVHVHAFDCGFRVRDCPVVMGGDVPYRYLYAEARGYAGWRVRAIEQLERFFAGLLGVNLLYYHTPQAQRLIAPTESVRQWYLQRGLIEPAAIDHIPTYLPGSGRLPGSPLPRRIGFVAQDFDAKGGPLLLAAFARVQAEVPDAELVIVGSPARMEALEQKARRIRWLPRVSRDKLLNEIMPGFDVFAYPTHFDGLPLVLLEAMGRGLAIAATDYRAIPEMLDHGRAGLLSPADDADALAANLLRLLDPATNARMRAAAHAFFGTTYAAEAVHEKLLASYRRAVAGYEECRR